MSSVLLVLHLLAAEFLAMPEIEVFAYEGGRLYSEAQIRVVGLDYVMTFGGDAEQEEIFVERHEANEFILRIQDKAILLDLGELLVQTELGEPLELGAYEGLSPEILDSLFSSGEYEEYEEYEAEPPEEDTFSRKTQTTEEATEEAMPVEAWYRELGETLILSIEGLLLVLVAS